MRKEDQRTKRAGEAAARVYTMTMLCYIYMCEREVFIEDGVSRSVGAVKAATSEVTRALDQYQSGAGWLDAAVGRSVLGRSYTCPCSARSCSIK